jgi:hypothetical protein
MQSIVAELNRIADEHLIALEHISEDKFNFKPSPTKWSKREILGHLVDSAQNNIRRFIVSQYENEPKITYNQDRWVAISNYRHYPLPDLISLWFLLNKHICHILSAMTPEMTERKSASEELHSIKWLAEDYVKHLLHHFHQVLDLEPIAYP